LLFITTYEKDEYFQTSIQYVIFKTPHTRLLARSLLPAPVFRASHFDVDEAAFEKKLKLFGPSKITKTISLDDSDADDKDCLTSRQSQLFLAACSLILRTKNAFMLG
jgi:hypothetical protein